MRVMAGIRRGVDLRCGHGIRFRPTQQIVKGSIFETIGREIEGAVFLDLFSGSGAIGIEALSRGAGRAIFVEQDRRMLRAIRANLLKCGFGPEQATVRISDATRFLERAAIRGDFFDFVFADPPYECDAAQRIVDIIACAGKPLCRMLIVEHTGPISAGRQGVLEVVKVRKFGQTRISYFGYLKEDEADE